MSVSIDDALSQLGEMRRRSILGGDTALVLSLSGSGLEVVEIDSLSLQQDVGRPEDGAAVEVRVSHPALV